MSFSCPNPSCDYLTPRQADLIQHLIKATAPGCITAGLQLQLSIRRPIRHDRPQRSPDSPPLRGRHTRSPSPQQSSDSQAETTPCSPHPAAPVSDSESAIEVEPSQLLGDFEGDFFGAPDEYSEDDFPFDPAEPPLGPEEIPQVQTDGYTGRNIAEDDDEDEDDDEEAVGINALAADWHGGMEGPALDDDLEDFSESRPTTPQPPRQPSEEHWHDEVDLDPLPPPGPGGVDPEDHRDLHEPPVRVRRFKGQAGAPLSEPEARVSGYAAYATKVPGSSENPYAPFASQLDWEVAQWAKLRGPSSTAFSDFLKIKGVCRC